MKYSFIEEGMKSTFIGTGAIKLGGVPTLIAGTATLLKYVIDRFGTSEKTRKRLIQKLSSDTEELENKLKVSRDSISKYNIRHRIIKNKAVLDICKHNDLSKLRKTIANDRLKRNLVKTALVALIFGGSGAVIGNSFYNKFHKSGPLKKLSMLLGK